MSAAANNAMSGAIANQSIDGAGMCVDGRERADHLPASVVSQRRT